MANTLAAAFAQAGLISQDELKKQEKNKEYVLKRNALIVKYGTMKEIYEGLTDISNEKSDAKKYLCDAPQEVVKKLKLATMTSTKLRQYYDMINGMYRESITEKELKEALFMTLAKANYDNGRKNIPKEFVDFLGLNINLLSLGEYSEEEFLTRFKNFKKHFECVVAYAKGQLADK